MKQIVIIISTVVLAGLWIWFVFNRSQTKTDNQSENKKFRYIKLHRLKTRKNHPINLAEIEVMSNGKNVACGKTVTQSSRYRDIGNPSDLTNGVFTDFIHTKDEEHEWVLLDLGESLVVDIVTIYNRIGIDYVTEPATGIEIQLSNSADMSDATISDAITLEQSRHVKFDLVLPKLQIIASITLRSEC